MNDYINISLECSPFLRDELDLRVPTSMTLKELVQIVSDAYGLEFEIVNPSARNKQSGEVLTSTETLSCLKNGVLLQLESI